MDRRRALKEMIDDRAARLGNVPLNQCAGIEIDFPGHRYSSRIKSEPVRCTPKT